MVLCALGDILGGTWRITSPGIALGILLALAAALVSGGSPAAGFAGSSAICSVLGKGGCVVAEDGFPDRHRNSAVATTIASITMTANTVGRRLRRWVVSAVTRSATVEAGACVPFSRALISGTVHRAFGSRFRQLRATSRNGSGKEDGTTGSPAAVSQSGTCCVSTSTSVMPNDQTSALADSVVVPASGESYRLRFLDAANASPTCRRLSLEIFNCSFAAIIFPGCRRPWTNPLPCRYSRQSSKGLSISLTSAAVSAL